MIQYGDQTPIFPARALHLYPAGRQEYVGLGILVFDYNVWSILFSRT